MPSTPQPSAAHPSQPENHHERTPAPGRSPRLARRLRSSRRQGRQELRVHRAERPLHRLSPQRLRPAAPVGHHATVQRARWSLVGMFGLFGIISTSWLGRLPSVREGLDVSAGSLGLLLVVGAVGSLVGVTLIGTVIVRFGSRTTLRAGMLGALVGFSLIGLGVALGSVPLFSAGILLNGLAGPATNVPINLEAARVEKMLGKAVLPHVHASFSIGAAVGSALAATTSALQLHVTWHIVGVALLVTAGRAVLITPGTALQDAPQRATRQASGGAAPDGGTHRGAGRSALRAWTEPRTLLIGLVILAASLSEGAAANWLNLAVVDGFATREAVGAVAYGTFVVAMLAVRLLGAGLIDRYGRVAVLRVSGISSFVGLAAFGLAPSLPLAWVGIVLWGMGAALAYPVGTAAAADDPTKAAARVSVVGSFGSIASLSAPPVLGLLADAWGIRHALLVITAAMVVSLLAAGKVRPETVHAPEQPSPETADQGAQDTEAGTLDGEASMAAPSATEAESGAVEGTVEAVEAVEAVAEEPLPRAAREPVTASA
ncbi:MFS transporter [Xylanimonas oleitrophica]|uniref:MFS transporter n=1 Tax=Xylanimonas oleitrophica TaxID=2607479 RepID=A0A2W5WZ87_9MICO|nr:MFS transporter [Xylanimonas oleitrophica]PZR53205.1 MFS transporter [Xylanimonas oleitrophica]